jgi:predicted phage replisome organizer
MADVKWIKICTDIFDDEKMLLIESMPEADAIIVIWFKLLCLAGKQNNSGVFMLNDKIAYTDEMLATIFRRPINTVRLALKTFESFGMIEIVDNVFTIPNWEKHQSLDKLETAKEKNRQRVAKHRERQKLLAGGNANGNVTSVTSNAVDIEEDKERDIEEEKKEKKSVRKTASRFTPPTLEEVQAYCLERGNNVDCVRFIDYYTANGWKVGKNPMKDWKAAVRTWERTSDAKPAPNQSGGAMDGYDEMSKIVNGGLL